MYVSLYELGVFTLFAITVAVSCYLIAVLRRVYCVLGHVRGILDSQDDNIRNILSSLTEILSNVNVLAMSLNETAAHTNEAFCYLQNNLTDTLDDLRSLETIAVYGKVIGDVFKTVFSKAA